MFGLFYYRYRFMVTVELDNTVTFRIINVIPENSSAVFDGGGSSQGFAKTISIEDIISKNKCAGFASDKIFSDDESLRQTIRRRLNLVTEIDSILATVSQKSFKVR